MKNRQPKQWKVSIRKWFREIWCLTGQDPLGMVMIVVNLLEAFAVLIVYVVFLLVSLAKYFVAA